MINFPDLPRGVEIETVAVELMDTDCNWTLKIKTDDEGAGSFAIISLDGEMRLDPGELETLGKLATDLCEWVEEGQKRSSR